MRYGLSWRAGRLGAACNVLGAPGRAEGITRLRRGLAAALAG
jgi:hypothetical protein